MYSPLPTWLVAIAMCLVMALHTLYHNCLLSAPRVLSKWHDSRLPGSPEAPLTTASFGLTGRPQHGEEKRLALKGQSSVQLTQQRHQLISKNEVLNL